VNSVAKQDFADQSPVERVYTPVFVEVVRPIVVRPVANEEQLVVGKQLDVVDVESFLFDPDVKSDISILKSNHTVSLWLIRVSYWCVTPP
jgi:hypothetical protein